MIVTLTTIPPRMRYLPMFFAGLARQKSKPDAVELYVPRTYRRFPGIVPSLPALPDWVKVIRIDEDLGPATKVLPAAERWRGKDVDLLFADDDRIFDRNWTARFAAMRRDDPNNAICEHGIPLPKLGFPAPHPDSLERPLAIRWEVTPFYRFLRRRGLTSLFPAAPSFTRPGFVDTFAAFCGVLVKPDWFDAAAYDIPAVLWTVDDIWLSGHIIRGGRDIRTTARPIVSSSLRLAALTHPLFDLVEEGADRLEANRRCVTHFQETYGIWRPKGPLA